LKILDTFESLATLTASGSDADFPLANINDIGSLIRWHAASYAADQWVKNDFGTAIALTAIFLNQCNFPQCYIEGHATDDWAAPSFSQLVTLSQDRCSNRKAWATLTGFNYRWLRILIPSGQALDNSESVPAIGNVLCGTSAELPPGTFAYPKNQEFYTFKADGGPEKRTTKGIPWHTITLSLKADKTEIEAVNSVWPADCAVVFFDVGNVAQAFLVDPPPVWDARADDWPDMRLILTLSEKI